MARHLKYAPSTWRRRGIVSVVVTGGLLGGGLVGAQSGWSAGLIPSTTTVSASPATSVAGTPVTLTAKVEAAVVGGALVTPSGTVTFTASNGSSTTALGSGTLGSCVLSACTASITTTLIPGGSTSVTGRYSGDALVAPSSGSTPVDVSYPTTSPPPDGGTSSTNTCPAGTYCPTGTVVSGKTNMKVIGDPSSSTQTVHGQLDTGKTIHCVGDNDNQTGVLGTFDSTATDAGKTVNYIGQGNVGSQMIANYTAHPQFVGCYASTYPFKGYVNGVYTDARSVKEPFGAFYEAQPSNCARNGGQLPCFTNMHNADGSDVYQVKAPKGDPKFIG